MSGDYYAGIGLFSPFQIGYLMFNEQKRLQLALKVIYLQLPIIEYPNLVKGIYLTHDYNRNPIARRILFVRKELTPEEADYYDYTCHTGDVIKSMMLVSPDKNIEDLKREKRILELL